jgi:phage shock protein E
MRIAALVLLLVTALACDSPAPDVRDISQDDFLANTPGSTLVLDVRTPDEFSSGHVPGAMNISHEQLASRLDELGAAKDTPVVVYCERGGRAGKAAAVLLEAGFSDIQHLAGDMQEWRANKRPTE